VVRSWIRQALRASGVAILVPAAVVAAIAVSVVGGGGRVGSLGAVLNGPAVPPAEAATAHPDQPRRDERPRARRVTAPAARVPAQVPRPASAPPPLARPPVRTLPVRRPVPRRPAPQPSAGSLAPAPTTTSPPPAPAPRPIHDTGTQVAQTVRPLPVAGPVAADAVQAVVDIVDPPA
jgi:hypothetical protein